MAKRRVVVTGLGIVSPVGNDLKSSWSNILAGKSGISLITDFDTSDQAVKFAGTVKDFDASEYIPKKDLKKMDTFIHYGIAASDEAIKDSGIEITEENSERIGIAVGSGIGGLPLIEKNKDAMDKGGPRRISPFLIPGSIINMISGNLSIKYGIKGPNIALVTACTTGTHSIGMAARMIAYGDADVMIAGGAEKASSPLGIGGFAAARALSRNNDNFEAASRPWDKDRDGFVLGDGAGVLVLEEYEHAKARGAKIYCEMAGFGMSGDAYHMTSPSVGGEGAARCMINAIKDAGLNKEDIQFVNAHGTSTPAGDVAETMAMKAAFGDHAKSLAVTSTKSMTGHLLGAAGGIEAVFSVMSLVDQVASPTINLDNQDPECDLDYVPNTARDMKMDAVLSNSFGFGGTNGTVLFKKI
ncbi:MAG: beta-ketoacyl-[acyl-carrier-protein] synthase II [endosymbiont of Galathealinum brachiosum]|uniref:3-oxoacyl-[acyl-carrier-protein] synthase 2 n=1 Tax=endosymbiont of Galathealinum brachiosum TaxID=2200906 RepID=A0A370DMH8_9GAMM|nr:MAG: beta-ketoacyl-[acyl-carrier-protein] synthase II [endosymbiont of Galathealinum brachiosum]